jgi:hypothetical protein
MSRRKREIAGLTNERDFPHLVELAVPPGGFRLARAGSAEFFLSAGNAGSGVLREAALQDKSGPSVAVEFGPLLPGVHDEQGWGASWLGIVSQRWSGGTIHFDLGVALTREHRGDLFVGTIFEGPYDWTVRPVAEVVYEREFNTTETFSALAGAIWKVSDDLSFDFGLREAWVNHQPVTEIRAGLTFAISLPEQAMQRSSRSLRR